MGLFVSSRHPLVSLTVNVDFSQVSGEKPVKFEQKLPDTSCMVNGVQTRWIALCAIGGFVATIFLTGHVQSAASPNASFLPAMLAVVGGADGLTAFMLFQKFLAGGRGRLVGIGSAYLFAALAVIPYALAIPGVVTANGPLDYAPSVASWLWVSWHVGFPAFLSVALLSGSHAERWTVTQSRRRAVVGAAVCITPLVLVALTLGIVAAHEALPVVTEGGNSHQLLTKAGWWIIAINGATAFIAITHSRENNGMLAWVPVAAASSLADVVITLFSESVYTIGWYSGRVLGFFTSSVILAALLVEFTRLYKESEANRRVLEDEALDLLRENRAALYREDRVRRVIENAADAYIEINRDGVIQAWNGKATEMFGWTNTDVESRQFVETVMNEQGWEEFKELISEFWTSPDRFDGSYAELLVRSGDGREFPAEATLWVDESDFEPRMSFFLRDITIRRETQERLQQALVEEREALLRLQEIDRVKSDFVSSISHELRSPLTNTLGYLELLADGDAGSLTDDQLRMVMVAQRNAHRLFALIEDLLTLSRVEEGAFSVRFRAVAMQDVLNVVLSSHLVSASERGVSVSSQVADVVGVCPGDANQLTRALSNIVNNAIKFTDPGGSVAISARQLLDEIEIKVVDSGIGIAPEEQSHLFERFFRTSISIEQQYQGAGLGLTITKAIIDHHGGSVKIDSHLGKGTTVTVRLPAMTAVPPVRAVQPIL